MKHQFTVAADDKGKFDELVEEQGVRVLIDPGALMHVIGTKMDFVEDRLKYVLTAAYFPSASSQQLYLAPLCFLTSSSPTSLKTLRRPVDGLLWLQVRICVRQSKCQGELWLWRVVQYLAD